MMPELLFLLSAAFAATTITMAMTAVFSRRARVRKAAYAVLVLLLKRRG